MFGWLWRMWSSCTMSPIHTSCILHHISSSVRLRSLYGLVCRMIRKDFFRGLSFFYILSVGYFAILALLCRRKMMS